jgi:hypothetical protein
MSIMYEPAPLLSPIQRGPWGVVTRLAGPPGLPDDRTSPHAAALRQADARLRYGMVLLSRLPRDAPDRVWHVLRARRLFREALTLLLDSVGELHPRTAYAYDRVGYAQQEWGEFNQARRMYLTSSPSSTSRPCATGSTGMPSGTRCLSVLAA